GSGGSMAPAPGPLPDQLPFTSVDEMVIFAEQSVRRGYISIGSVGTISDMDTLTYADVVGNDYAEVVAKLVATKLRFKVVESVSWFSVWVNLRTADDLSVLQAGTSFRLEFRDGKYVVPEAARHLELMLNNGVYQHLPGVGYIEFIEVGSSGDVVYIHTIYPIGDGLFFIPAYFSQNKRGTAVYYIRTSEGGFRGIAYDLKTGLNKATPIQKATGFSIGTRDVYRFTDATNIVVHVSNNRRPILHLTYTMKVPVHTLQVTGEWNHVIERPSGGLLYEKRSDGGWSAAPFSGEEWQHFVEVGNDERVADPGEYYLRFTFPTYGTDSDNQFDRPYGGKG
ncbi:MAG: hypothetical protein Greene041679_233, partial [Parcubacteria group bacterium Greene0416_79]